MSKLLHISASPRGDRSESLAVATTFLDSFRAARPRLEVETFDLWDGSLPAFGPAAVGAKMAVLAGLDAEGEEAAAWRAARETFRRFDSADRYLFSVPMWNHHMPYVLKQFIDVVSQPGMVFGFDQVDGYTGLLRGKKAAVIYTGAVWGPDRGKAFGTDHLTPYFEDWLRWAGIEDVSTIRFQPNLATADPAPARREADAAAASLGRAFAAGVGGTSELAGTGDATRLAG